MKEQARLSIGIDIGSTTAKIVVVEAGQIIYENYQRHFSQVRQKTLELLEGAAPRVGKRPFTAAISGSAGLGLAESAGIPFVQEVFATGEVVRRLEPDASAVVELGGEDAKIIFFDGGMDERMNGSCAGGTGAFIDQMAMLLNVTTDELDRLSLLARSYLGTHLVAGVGLACQGPEELHRCVEGARSALDYRALTGGGRVIYIGDLEPQSSAVLSFEEEDQRALSAAVKLGTPEQVERVVRGLMERLSQTGLSLSQCHLFLLEVVTCLVRLTRSGGVAVEKVFGSNFTGAVSISDFSSLEELGRWLGERCLKLHDLLGRQRTDSAWRLVEQAKEYIAGHYTDERLSVESLCAHIHLSPTYFSTLFKREVGMSFTAYVTQVRMDEAARLLRESDEKTYRIAERTGYSDPNYFSYVFKRRYGVSPSKFRSGLKG